MSLRTETLLVVEKTMPHERLDTFLRAQFPTLSRGAIQRLIQQGDIRVAGKPVKASHPPRAGEKIEIHWPDARPAAAQPQEMPLDVLFEDDDLLVLNKPPGMVVHPSAGHEESTLVNALLHHCAGQLSGIGGVARPGIVHRLDKETSGCLVVAKDDPTHLALSTQFAGREVEKIYHAIVCGAVTPERGGIRANIARHPSHRKRMAVTDGGGREAWTSYRVLERLREAALVEALPHTGRTHQIRVHLKHLGFPLVGDATYGNRQNKRLTELTGYDAPRQMLHAQKLAFRHPRMGKKMSFEAPWPEDFKGALAALR
ncbi:MAG: RluA family pseudouridine synthase [Verrucomicrobia bacterium]|nr:MAG: RluA family pseudouridine synthase [Verrucomicrobiota bacterium]PYK00023.1 MAG: RluA family pseudouridine synthase [Verrucomicrobiota bacterium]